MKIKNIQPRPTLRLQAKLESLPDDEVFTAVELSSMTGLSTRFFHNKVYSLPDNNFSDGTTRWWGSKRAIIAAKQEILNRENQKA